MLEETELTKESVSDEHVWDDALLCEECFYSNTVGQDVRKFMEYHEAGLDQGYKCPRCHS